MIVQCPINGNTSFSYNSSLCACNPGYVYNASSNSCWLFKVEANDWVRVDSGIDYSINIPNILSFDAITRFSQSQAVFLEATLVMLITWLLFCFFARFGKLGDGRTPWFKIRWWISRLDVCFPTRHWLDDQKVVMKRKTELGGAFSIASWILFIGLFATLLYQILSKRTIEVHNLRTTNAPELASFANDIEFNITTISSMSCSHLRGLDTLVTGSPSLMDHRVAPLASFFNHSCHNSSNGPTVTFTCFKCQLVQDYAYISWHFVDLPNDPVTAVGFQFNLTLKDHASKKRMSFVSGIVKSRNNLDDKLTTFRGLDPNILKFNLFPRIYRNLNDLKLIQPLFHEFIPGSYFSEMRPLQASLQSSADGLINTTISVNFLSAYIVEIDNESVMGPVSFLADLGGLYCISLGIFFFLLVQCEYRIKKLRNEDSVMRNIRSRRKAKENWGKLRKYVKYTWDCSAIDDEYKSTTKDVCCTGLKMESLHKQGSSHKQRLPIKMDTISFNRKFMSPSKKEMMTKSLSRFSRPNEQFELSLLFSSESILVKNLASIAASTTVGGSPIFLLLLGLSIGLVAPGCLVQKNVELLNVKSGNHHSPYKLPPPPPLEFRNGSGVSVTDLQKDLQNLYEYNIMLRENMNMAQSMISALASKASSSAAEPPNVALRDSSG